MNAMKSELYKFSSVADEWNAYDWAQRDTFESTGKVMYS